MSWVSLLVILFPKLILLARSKCEGGDSKWNSKYESDLVYWNKFALQDFIFPLLLVTLATVY